MTTETLVKNDISNESYREYDFGGRTYRIDSPITLFFRKGGSTHRIVDANGLVHLVPGPGYRGAVIRWMPKDTTDPVQF